MKGEGNKSMRNIFIKISATALVLAIVITSFYLPFGTTANASVNQDTVASLSQFNKRSAPDFDLNLSRNLQNLRQASGAQTAALNNLKAAVNAPNMTARWNEFGGSPDVLAAGLKPERVAAYTLVASTLLNLDETLSRN